MINELVKRKIPILKGEEIEEREVGFYFGVIILKYVESEMGMEITDLADSFKDIKKNISKGFDTVIRFLYCAHKSWMVLQEKDPEITENNLWFAFGEMGNEEFLALFAEGLGKLTDSVSKVEEVNPKMPSPKS